MSPRRPIGALALVIGTTLLLAPWWSQAGVQRCHAHCQEEKTECIIRCDGDEPCEMTCQQKGESCAEQCFLEPVAPVDAATRDTSPREASRDALSDPSADTRRGTRRD